MLSELENQILKYLDGRKTPATLKQIAKATIRSDSHIKAIMILLEEKGLVNSIKVSSLKLFAKK
jgi:DNA-binding IscR family transcriptional regulator